KSDVEQKRRVVNEDVLSNEVACFRDGQVVDLMLASGRDRDDLVPIDVTTGHLGKASIAKYIGVIRQASLCNSPRRMRVEAALTSPFLARVGSKRHQRYSAHFRCRANLSP